MSTGFLALLDDVAALVKASAASLDDISAQVAKTGGQVSGVVIDDAAVTPKYVAGLDPSRELLIIWHIARQSVLNKLLFLGPAALLLGFFAPWIITPVLMLGGCYLCREGYEKVHVTLARRDNGHAAAPAQDDGKAMTPEELEALRIKSAVRTDFILSAEIIAITYASVAETDVLTQIAVMTCIAVAITAVVYGFVGLIVKIDDIGVHLARTARYEWIRKTGRRMVTAMPRFLKILSAVGTAAMLWVGAEIIAHGVPPLHHGLAHLAHAFPGGLSVLAWPVKALLCAAGGVAVGFAVDKLATPALAFYRKARARKGSD